MALKNAVRILAGRFGVVWGILLFLLIYIAIMVSVSLGFLLPIINALSKSGVKEEIEQLYELVFRQSFTLAHITKQLGNIWDAVAEAYHANVGLVVNSALFIAVFVLVNRFVLGYYELPVTETLVMKMSSNVRIGFLNKFISNIKLSSRFIPAKMIFTIVCDAFISLIMWLLLKLWGVTPLLTLFVPFIVMLAYILLQSLRYTLIAVWAPATCEKRGAVFASFGYSVKTAGRNFGAFFASFVTAWVLIIAVNVFVGLITFGAGLLLTIPMTMAFICTLNLTLYYGAVGKRYYIDDERVVEKKHEPQAQE